MAIVKQYKRTLIGILILGLGLLFTPVIVAQVSSQNDLSWSALLNGGGARQSETNQVEDALGEWQGGTSTSENTVIVAGFVQAFSALPVEPVPETNAIYLPMVIR